MQKNASQQGLYVPEMEHDNCGIGFIANLKGYKTHKTVNDALTMLENMEHRGGTGYDINTGDGAGILIQIPHEFFVIQCKNLGFKLPQFGGYAVGMIFFPKDKKRRENCRKILNEAIEKSGLELLGYRKVPVNSEGIGQMALDSAPVIEQLFVRLKFNLYAPGVLERRVFVLRKFTTNIIRERIPDTEDDFYLSSMSYKTIVYKGQLTTRQLRTYYPDLEDAHLKSAIALIHSRFSTNTFPKWKLAQPFDFIAHNGEINTIKGNVNWMRAKEVLMNSALFTNEEFEMMLPICNHNRSDSSNLDSIIEMLLFGGRSLPHAMMMLIPEAWQEDKDMDPLKRAFYEYHASFMEPWDGPASICFTDGRIVGATLDRNGLRPSRYALTDDDYLVMSSEAGALILDEKKIVKKGRVQPGKMFVADIEQGRIISDEELKKEICAQQPYQEWLDNGLLRMEDLVQKNVSLEIQKPDSKKLRREQIIQGMTSEDLRVIVEPMMQFGKEPIGSMGSDIPLAALSKQSRHISHYFKQLFAQVSNPPIDPIRERLVMSLYMRLGQLRNFLHEKPSHCRQIHIDQPILSKTEFRVIKEIDHKFFRTATIKAAYNLPYQKGELKQALHQLCVRAEKAIEKGTNILIISNKLKDDKRMPIPSLLALSTVHHHLLNRKLRGKAALIVEAGDAWETHHFATLIGYGASAVYPYLADNSITEILLKKNAGQTEIETYLQKYRSALNKGLFKIMSKMGISTLQSYMGAQIFEAIGLSKKMIDYSFTGTVSRIEGLDFDDLAKEQLLRYKVAYPEQNLTEILPVGGIYQWKRQGEKHLFNPDTVFHLQQACKTNKNELYRKYAESINDQSKDTLTLRGLLEIKKSKKSIPINEVEPAEEIFKRFATGAMSFGSISHEAHSTLAIAMNRIGGKSNSGEGGEDEIRFKRKENGDWERSAIKQVASGRFGVTSNYLANANELQIKMAQGAKPGEGGQLPGHKVNDWIGRVRHSTPGVDLISPPPHHDIYSIEDLAQLIFDLKNSNRAARINVKLVSEAGVGTIAAGVVKAKADVILISGHDGGTGASPLSSIQHAGLPWELGLAEAHQTLITNKLRNRVTLQTDGQLRTGRDIAIATMLGAEEWGISSAALVVMGCIMMRKCHLNTCPVGVATQKDELRELFTGDPDHVVNFFRFLAEDLREIMAGLGIKTVNELVGRSDLLQVRKDVEHWKLKKLDLSPVLKQVSIPKGITSFKTEEQAHLISEVIDWKMLDAAMDYFKSQKTVHLELPILNTDRAVGTLLSNEISKKYGSEGIKAEVLHYSFKGSAGQSFGAFAAKGLLLELEGEGNDYFGKGLSGATLVAYPNKQAPFVPEEQIIIGNVALYGATSGKLFVRGQAGERFAVRNSGVQAVVEGVGDHGCEYMTGGAVVILGEVGRNFGAGMSGGTAFVLDNKKQLETKSGNPDLIFDNMDAKDKRVLNSLIKEHYERTGSTIAQQILIYWKDYLNQFVKVIPAAYKAILEERNTESAVIRKIG
ncbi:MAG: glutamate synthase large subunit [Chitinophagales bacterium]